LGRVALAMTNVADGISTTSEASKILTGIMKGFNIEAKDAIGVTDILNEVSNNTATSFDGLADVLMRSGSALAIGGNSFVESISLATGALEVMGADASERVATSLKSMSVNIVKNAEDIEKMTGVTMSYNGEILSLYDTLVAIKPVWDGMNESQRMDLAMKISGKTGYQTLSATMQNFNTVLETSSLALQASGSTMKENANAVESLEGRVNALKGAWQEFSDTFMNSDFIKNGLTILTKGIEWATRDIEKFTNQNKELEESIKADFGEAWWMKSDEIRESSEAIEDNTESINRLSEANTNLTKTSEEYLLEMQDLMSANDDFLDSNQGVINGINALDEAIGKATEGQMLNAQEIANLIDMHPGLVDAIEETNGMYTINIDKMREARQETINLANASVDGQRFTTSVMIQETKNRIDAMQQELLALQQLSSAY
ncbi:MAG: phage tail tape measure protein, partial [Bacteroidales bacterium]